MNFTTHPSFAKLPFRSRPYSTNTSDSPTTIPDPDPAFTMGPTYAVPESPSFLTLRTSFSLELPIPKTPTSTRQTIGILHSRLDSACRIAQLQTAFQDELIHDLITYTQENFAPRGNNAKRYGYIVTETDMSKREHILVGKGILARIAYYKSSVRHLREFLENGVERYLVGVSERSERPANEEISTNEERSPAIAENISQMYVIAVINTPSINTLRVNSNHGGDQTEPFLPIPLTDTYILSEAQQAKSRLRQLQLYLKHYDIFAMNTAEELFNILFAREENPSFWLAGEIETRIALHDRQNGGVLVLDEGQSTFWYRKGMENTLMRAELFGLIRRRGWNQRLHNILVRHGRL